MNSLNDIWDALDPGFFAPVWLLVGAVALIAITLLELGTRRWRRQALHQFTAPHLLSGLLASVSGPRRLLKTGLRLAALALVFTALARPHLFYEWREESRNGFDLLFAVDCSKSMLTEDVLPNRLERAKLAIDDFADHLRNNRLGLIAFAGDAFLQCPLTLDHSAFNDAVQEIDTNAIPRPGTDIATAIQAAEQALRTQPNNQKFVILVTDGEDLEGRAISEARNAAREGLRIFTVGVGTAAGGQIPQRDDSGAIQFWHDANGQPVSSRLDEVTLQQIATITGGAYVPLGQRGEGLESIYQTYIAPLPQQHFEEKRQKVEYEQFEWPLGLALLLLTLEFLLSERAKLPPLPEITSRGTLRRRRAPVAVAAGLALNALLVGASSSRADAISGQRAYQKGDFPAALKDYRDAAAHDPNRPDLQYDRGEAAYREGEFSEAEEAFRKTLETPNLDLQNKAYYNLGNAQYRHGESLMKGATPDVDAANRTIELWKQALKSYDAALKLQDTKVARDNYEFVKTKIHELVKSQAQKQKSESQSSGGSNNSPGDGSSPANNGHGEGQTPPDNPNGNGNESNANGQNPADAKTKPAGSAPGQTDDRRNLPGRSAGRTIDQADAAARSRQEAEDLLDSLKEDEGHVTARSLSRDQQTPPPPSGKDW